MEAGLGIWWPLAQRLIERTSNEVLSASCFWLTPQAFIFSLKSSALNAMLHLPLIGTMPVVSQRAGLFQPVNFVLQR
ncbi:hypothetical protein [Sphingobium sp. EP60837]|uniref:hypothetical protein n=1 Tax=Sphingobium sp. EP60837 TaxID=1855519 RepID=UPI001CEDDA4A|nr:hypothetical protein [Sphingobium sp. EP60837]